MKTSNKIFIVAIGILLLSLALHDFTLRAAFRRNDYRRPDHDFVKLDFHSFDRIYLESGTALNLKIEQGPYQIKASPYISDYLKIKEVNGVLTISAAFPEHYQGLNVPYALYINCPQLHELTADARYTFAGHPATDTVAHDLDWRPTLISGFTGDSLVVEEDNAANVRLEHNKLNTLKILAATGHHAGSGITIGTGNHIAQANYDIRHFGVLRLQTPTGGEATYQLADSAHFYLDGVAAKSIIKP